MTVFCGQVNAAEATFRASRCSVHVPLLKLAVMGIIVLSPCCSGCEEKPPGIIRHRICLRIAVMVIENGVPANFGPDNRGKFKMIHIARIHPDWPLVFRRQPPD
ncbi:MAG: hypothetical protein R3C26_21240 [Calditrichia bacterium]